MLKRGRRIWFLISTACSEVQSPTGGGHLIFPTLYTPHNAIIVCIWVPQLQNNRVRLRFDYNFSHKLIRIATYFFIRVLSRTSIYDIRFDLLPVHFQKQRHDICQFWINILYPDMKNIIISQRKWRKVYYLINKRRYFIIYSKIEQLSR